MKTKMFKPVLTLLMLTFLSTSDAFAAGGGIGALDSVTAELATYVDSIGDLILIIGAIVGLVGGVRVYIKWNNGDQDVNKAIMGWMASCMFLALVGTIVNAFFI